MRIEDAGRQPKHRVQVEVREQLASDGLARAALEEDVVRQHDRSPTVGIEDRHDVLHEVQLLVARRGNEVLALDFPFLSRLATVGADHRQGGLLPERRVREHHRPPSTRVGDQGVAHLDERVAVGGAHPVQKQVHRGQSRGAVDSFR